MICQYLAILVVIYFAIDLMYSLNKAPLFIPDIDLYSMGFPAYQYAEEPVLGYDFYFLPKVLAVFCIDHARV